jgi:hypothetical protein
MMKDSTSPRRVYTRNDVIHVCYAGKTFAPVGGETEIKVGNQVKVAVSETNPNEAQVTFRRSHGKAIVETWKARKVPCHPRTEA